MFKKAKICYLDVGGTFTDCVIVDEEGRFVLQKAPSTPHSISEGLFEALRRTSSEAAKTVEEVLSELETFGFGATLVVNALLTRSGRKCGMIVTKGFEDILEAGRGRAGWVHLRYAFERAHVQGHYKLEPLIPRYLVKGVSERSDCQGQVVIPVYEDEVLRAAKELQEQGVEAIVVITLWSFLNSTNEERIAEITREVVGDRVEVVESAKVLPILREWERACTAVSEAYTAAILGRAVRGITKQLRDLGYKKDVLMMQSTGGVASAEKTVAVHTVQSGPVGGVIGGRFIGKHYGFDNLVTTDVGGTSFDVGLIIKGAYELDYEPVVLNMVLGVPIVQVCSIGAGGGSIAGVDPVTGDFFVGPKSAGAYPGPVCYGLGGELPTATDADVVLGYIDPDFFLGGHMQLYKEKAAEAIRKHVGEPLGIGVIEAAAGIKRLIDVKMAEALRGQILGRGLDSREFALLAFGGGGPTHVAGYTENMMFKEIMFFPYSAVFSAFGAATADIVRRRTATVARVIPPGSGDEVKMEVGEAINRTWQHLEEWILEELEGDGVSKDEATLRYEAAMRYGKQIHDVNFESPVSRINSPQDLDALIDSFENEYVKRYSMTARFARAGYEIYDVSVEGSYSKIKPVLPRYERVSEKPSQDSIKGRRPAYFCGGMAEVPVYDMSKLRAGNIVEGPCIVEAPTTTAVIPENSWVEVDEYLTFRLKRR